MSQTTVPFIFLHCGFALWLSDHREMRHPDDHITIGQREAFAASLHSARVKGFGDIEVEAILDAPLDVVVTSGPARGGRHMRGRRTEVQTAAFSTACAVENLWLAARAQSPGVGSVSFFDERERARTLALPSQEEIR